MMELMLSRTIIVKQLLRLVENQERFLKRKDHSSQKPTVNTNTGSGGFSGGATATGTVAGLTCSNLID